MTVRAGAVFLIFFLTGCAPKAPTLPTGAGVPFAGFAEAYAQAAEACGQVKTLTAVLSLSGRAGTQRLRGRIDAGLEAPDRIVLEGVAPFGRPYFVLAASGGRSTLLLPRDARVLRDAPPEAIVDAMTGVSLDPSELRLVLAGCGIPGGPPVSGQSFGGGWVSIATGTTNHWLRQVDGRWRVAASTRDALAVHYADFGVARPSTVRIRVSAGQHADLSLRLGDVDINVPLDPAVFRLEVPADAVPITLEELRRSGPLGRQ